MESANNYTVSLVLEEIAELLELKGEGSFRIRAYENAARAVKASSADMGDLSKEGRLQTIPGVGDALALKIKEYLDTGQMAYLDKLRAEFPEGVRKLMSIPGVGPKLAARVYHELGIESVDELEAAASDGRLAGLPRLGQKSADNVIRAIERAKSQETQRTPIGQVLPYVRAVMAQLRSSDAVRNLTVAGSLRRFQETIKDVDIIATSDDPDSAFELFLAVPGIREVVAQGPTKLSVLNERGLQIDFRIVPHESYGSLLQHFTGSKAHNVQLREYAVRRGESLSEYGIADVDTGERLTFEDEAEFYTTLDLPWIPPEIREGTGELAAAIAGNLPGLVTIDDIRGDLHMHTDWSDGTGTIEEMVRAAESRGHEYVAITDHSQSRGSAGGLDVARLAEQQSAIDEARKKFPNIRILRGSEVDIKGDGTLDFPDEVLSELDWVVASIHSSFNMSVEQMTARMIAAIENPNVDVIGHPTGRLLGSRPPYELDMDQIFEAALRSGTALEVNCHPKRLDIKDSYVRRAVELGINISIDTDAHSIDELNQLEFGISVARRGWAEPKNVVNAGSCDEVLGRRRYRKGQVE